MSSFSSHQKRKPIPYSRQSIDDNDVSAVVEALRADLLTTGPLVSEFERSFATYVGVEHGVAVNSGTAALHCAMWALGVGEGDEVIVPPLTFAATANCALYVGAKPVFVDVCPETLLINPIEVERHISSRTKAIIAVDYAGHPCDYDHLRHLARKYGVALVSDACHSLGGAFKGQPVGSLADISCFSFHPVKHLTVGEGGMAVTNDPNLAKRMRAFRGHGISTDSRTREAMGTWFYEMVDLGFNYRLTDIQCALGLSQLKKQASWLVRRREIAKRYNEELAGIPGLSLLTVSPQVTHAWHLYVIRLKNSKIRESTFSDLRRRGISVNVHYVPVHLHPYYRRTFSTAPGDCPVAEKAYEGLLSLPMFPALSEVDQTYVVEAIKESIINHSSE